MTRLPIPRAPISGQSLGGFSAPSPVTPRDQGPAQLATMGASLQAAGAAAVRIGEAEQEAVDHAVLLEATTAAAEVLRTKFGVYASRLGRDAVQSFDGAQRELRDSVAKLGDMARTPVQRELVTRRLATMLDDGLNRFAAHRAQQAQTWAIGSAEASTKGSVQDYVASLGNPEDMATHRELALRNADELARLKGMGEPEAAQLRLSITTQMHAGALDALVTAGRASEAGAYLDTYGGEIAPQQRTQALRTVKRATVADKSQRLVDEMRGRGVQFGEQIQSIDMLFQQGTLTVEERDEAVQRVVQADTLDRQARAAEAADVLTAGEQFLASGQSQRLADNPQLYARAERAGVLPQLLQFERSRRADTNPLALAEAMSLPDEALANVTRAEIVQRYWGKLSKSDLESVLARRDRAAGEGRSGGSGPNVLSIDDRVKSAFLRLKGAEDTGRIDDELAVEFQTFRTNVQEQLDAEREAGQKVTPQRLQQILDDAKTDLIYKEQPSWWSWGKPVSRLLVSDAEEETAGVMAGGSQWVPLASIPAAVRAEIIRGQHAAGLRVTDALVADAWVAMGKPKTIAEFPKGNLQAPGAGSAEFLQQRRIEVEHLRRQLELQRADGGQPR